jgi:hypothetical protein
MENDPTQQLGPIDEKCMQRGTAREEENGTGKEGPIYASRQPTAFFLLFFREIF